MLWVPAVRAVVAHCAVRLLPLPPTATAEQLAIEAAPSLKFTVPVGALPVTLAVKVTLTPTVAGLTELAAVELLATLLTTCDNALLVEGPFDALPLYAAVMLWVAAVRALVAHCAVRVLPLPASATAEQPLIELA